MLALGAGSLDAEFPATIGIRVPDPVDVIDPLDPGLVRWLVDPEEGSGIPGVLIAELIEGGRMPDE